MIQVEGNSALCNAQQGGHSQDWDPSKYAYIKLFEAMADYVRDNIKRSASPAIRRILALDQLDHPH